MADNYKTIGAVTVLAEQFDTTSDPVKIPSACEADGDWTRSRGKGCGYKVATDAMFCFPMDGDWVITKSGHHLVLSDAMFQILFEAV